MRSDGGLINSFLNSIDLQATEKYKYEVKETNRSWSPRTLAIARHINMNYREILGRDRFRFLEFISSIDICPEKIRIISPKDASLLLSKYQESNKKLALNYLDREDQIFDYSDDIDGEWEDPMCFCVDDIILLLIKAYLG